MSGAIVAKGILTPFELTLVGCSDRAANTEMTNKIRLKNLKNGELMLDKLSANAARKVRHSMHWLLYSHSSHCNSVIERRNFLRSNMAVITLTLPIPQFTNCRFIKNMMLAPFLRELTKAYDSPLYLWKAERQKNGNLHFHIIVARRICMHWVRFKWWKYCALNGYFRPAADANVWEMPPCTETDGLQHVSQIGSYLMKYVCKETGGEPIDGRIWGSCHQLVGITKVQIEVSFELWNQLQEFVTKGLLKFNSYDYCGRFVGDLSLIFRHVNNELLEVLKNHLNRFRQRMPDVQESRLMT